MHLAERSLPDHHFVLLHQNVSLLQEILHYNAHQDIKRNKDHCADLMLIGKLAVLTDLAVNFFSRHFFFSCSSFKTYLMMKH